MTGGRNTSAVFPLLLILLAFALFPVAEASGQADGKGTLSGTVRNAESGKEIPWADVIIQGIGKGGIVQANGTFTILNVPPGTYSVLVTMIGFTSYTHEGVVIIADQVNIIHTVLNEEATELEKIIITGQQTVDIKSSATAYEITAEDFKVRSIDNVTDALSKQPGVTVDGQGNLHVRGGRSSEVQFFVDGMPVSDPFVGTNTLDVSFASLTNIQLLSGGFDAEYGNAQSGVVNIQTSEGGRKFSGLIKYMTDDFGAPDKTYYNADNVAVAFGGPLVKKDLRFHVSGEMNFSDKYLTPNKEYTKHEIAGITFQDRMYNEYRVQGNLIYYFSPEKKLGLEYLSTKTLQDSYYHPFSRVGWWSEENRHWWYEPLDTTYYYYGGPDHMPRFDARNSQSKIAWTHTLSPETYYTCKVSLYQTKYLERIGHKSPGEYIPFFDPLGESWDPENRYFVVKGDYPHYQDYSTDRYTFKSDLTSQVTQRHQAKFGLQLDYYDMSMWDVQFPDPDDPDGPWPDQYSAYSWGGAMYAQDRMEYEGMILNGGLRLDFYDPGAEAMEVGNEVLASTFRIPEDISLMSRLKLQVSPRVGMAYPISDRDVMHFHYGRFYQLPIFERMYKGIGQAIEQDGGTYGNVFLQPEQTISYEFGVDHQITDLINLDMTVFFKDIFGLIDTREITNGSLASFGNSAPIGYVNQAYGTVKGLEFKLNRRLANSFGGSIVYTLARARGTQSNANTQLLVGAGTLDRPPLTETPLNWDHTHSLVFNILLTDPGVWEVSTDYTFETGGPFTPRRYQQRSNRADELNSRRLPDESRMDIRANKLYKIYGQEFRLFVDGTNLMNKENIRLLSPGDWPTNDGMYTVYYTETGQLGGAYNLNDVNSSAGNQFVSLGDPRVLDPKRRIRVGIMFDW